MARLLNGYSFLNGVVAYRRTNRSWTFKGRLRYARHQYLNRIAASQSSQRATLCKGQSLHCFVRAFAIHADAIIPAPLFLRYKMTGDRPVFMSSQKQHHHAPPEIIIGLAISSGFALLRNKNMAKSGFLHHIFIPPLTKKETLPS